MKINKDIIILILLFLAARWYLRNRNRLDNNLQPQIIIDPVLSSNTDWTDGLIMLTMNNSGNVYIDPNLMETTPDGSIVSGFTAYNDQGEQMHSNFWYIWQGLDPSNAEIYFDIGWLIDGSNYQSVVIEGQHFDYNSWEQVYRGCLDINDPRYVSNALYHAPQYDCQNFTTNEDYNIF